ncbi:MAG: hypothetical protein OEY97_04330 [Nitrospirota bacterium]|nr:hypothetical protein [Nitrospirota bacterium]
MMLVTAGCGATGGPEGGGASAAKDFKIDLPSQLVHHQVPGGTLVAEAHLANGSVVELNIDPATGAVQDSIRHSGPTLALDIVFLIDDGSTRTVVGRTTANLNWTDPLLATVVLTAGEIQFTNSDQDGFTDLMELALGSLPFDSGSFPTVSNRRSAAGYVLVDVMGSMTGRDGPVTGESTSADYRLY